MSPALPKSWSKSHALWLKVTLVLFEPRSAALCTAPSGLWPLRGLDVHKWKAKEICGGAWAAPVVSLPPLDFFFFSFLEMGSFSSKRWFNLRFFKYLKFWIQAKNSHQVYHFLTFFFFLNLDYVAIAIYVAHGRTGLTTFQYACWLSNQNAVNYIFPCWNSVLWLSLKHFWNVR